MWRRNVLRVCLLVLIFLLLAEIFRLSGEQAVVSDQTSGGVIARLLHWLVRDFDRFSPQEQQQRIAAWQAGVRTLAHFAEYTVLGSLVCAFLETFTLPCWRLLGGWGFCVLYAVSDEVHQAFVPGRACQASDVLVDSAGALLGTALVFGVCSLVRMFMKKRKELANGNN